jgi:hypothetical protein
MKALKLGHICSRMKNGEKMEGRKYVLQIAPLLFLLEAFCDISHRLGRITPFGVFSDALPGLKMWVTFAMRYCKNFNPFYKLNCSAR